MNKNITNLRRALKAAHPGVKYAIRTVSFCDLARGGAVVVTCREWTPERYREAWAIAQAHGALVQG